MKLISWNVNGLRAVHKKGAFNSIFEIDPDIICLQETKAHPEQLPDEVRSPVGYQSYFDHSKVKKGYSGVAIYIKNELNQKVSKVEYGLGKAEFDQEGRFLAVFLDVSPETKSIVLINCYFPNGGGGETRLDFKMKFYAEFLKYINKLKKSGHSVIFCGDVNTAHNEIDLSRPKENEKHTGFLKTEREWIDEVIKDGYIDTFRFIHPETIKYSWWDMKTFARDRNIGWRIDYFFVSDDLKNKIKKAEILDNIMGSDHCPVLLELK
jgi:exodeoxyribonuclease-3